jgi:tetratricopeptide (TPR) repeat protein
MNQLNARPTASTDSPYRWSELGRLENGKLDEALAALAPLAEVRAWTLYDLHVGLLNELGGRPAEADAAYKKALAEPEKLSFRVVEIIGNFYQRQKRPADAKAVYDAFGTTYPDNPLLPLLTEKQADANVAPIIGSARDGLAEALFNLASVLFQEDARDMAWCTRLALDVRKDYPAAQVLRAICWRATAVCRCRRRLQGRGCEVTLRLAGATGARRRAEPDRAHAGGRHPAADDVRRAQGLGRCADDAGRHPAQQRALRGGRQGL